MYAQVFAYVMAFTLVFRNNAAYARYLEARKDVQVMSAKWGDAACFALSFESQAQAPSREAFQAQRGSTPDIAEI